MSHVLGRFLRRAEPGRPSIYEHIRSHLGSDGPGLTEGGETLPERTRPTGDLRWAPGALDGVSTHHFPLGSIRERPEGLGRAFPAPGQFRDDAVTAPGYARNLDGVAPHDRAD